MMPRPYAPCGCQHVRRARRLGNEQCLCACSGPEVQQLLVLRSAFLNWAIYERTEGLNWTLGNPVCSGWGGVQCTAGSVTGLNFSGPDPAAPQRPAALQNVAASAAHSSQPIALQGVSLSSALCMASPAWASRQQECLRACPLPCDVRIYLSGRSGMCAS